MTSIARKAREALPSIVANPANHKNSATIIFANGNATIVADCHGWAAPSRTVWRIATPIANFQAAIEALSA